MYYVKQYVSIQEKKVTIKIKRPHEITYKGH